VVGGNESGISNGKVQMANFKWQEQISNRFLAICLAF
jgi:hypothetical protein